MKISNSEIYEAGRDPNFVMSMVNDLMAGIFGFFAGHFVACDYIYKHRQYVLERLYFER